MCYIVKYLMKGRFGLKPHPLSRGWQRNSKPADFRLSV
ncbi:hypothetical protein Cst_c24220 [Thermoclostridium stercorarium subsp. stercorarium DSM 8532]|uniref:Uncharacterized protein n=1 Tax=Thermoclostridium stercorarium (strain ATCC 35414 / DSM 8532 / NCIMB 11754) TaxID=1121335 RepID=L7VRH0_THES1|nr:hypothetical protein Cst_c24220 [Thermoclostridium stercorarium subsp. stercorarium DSM 8532]